MKVTVCQIDNINKNFKKCFNNLVDYLLINKTDLLLFPEMSFSEWLCKDKKPNKNKWKKAVREHNEIINILCQGYM